MAESLLIRIPETGVDSAEWAILDDQGNIAGDVMHTGLGEAAAHAGGRKVTVITSGEDVLLTHADVPPGSVAQARKAIPFSLEENLATDVDELHFAIGTQTEDKQYPVAIISREHMNTLQDQCDNVGLHPSVVVPESLAIPLTGGEEDEPVWFAMLANGRTILRQTDFQGFAVDADSFSPILDRALREADEGAPKKLNVYKVGDTQKPALTIATASANCESAIEIFARGLDSPTINLLQGDYSRRRQYGKLWRPWKVTAILFGVLLAVWIGSSVFEYVRLGQQGKQLDAQIASAYKQAFPAARNVQDAPRQMRIKLKQLGKGGGDFIAYTGEITRAISADKDLALRSINYREGRIDIEIDAARLELFDALKKRIDAGGKLTATIQSANKENNRVRGRVRITAR